MLDYEKLAQDFEAQQTQDDKKLMVTTEEAVTLPTESVETQVVEQIKAPVGGFQQVVGDIEQDILGRASEKINNEEIIDKHAENLKNIADEALKVEAEKASLTVQEQAADNKGRKQEIRNKLIVLRAEAKRLKREQKQLNEEQKADHKARNKAAKWELYKDKLERMHYSYVPCSFVLAMLLFFDGVRSFFDGLGTVSTAIVKALKWIFIGGAILAVLFIIPSTREWLINLFSGG